MTSQARRTLVLQRLAVAMALVFVVPLLSALGAAGDDFVVRAGEPSPVTVFAERPVRIVDAEATETARKTAAESVEPSVQLDREAQSAIIADVRDVFVETRDVRQPQEGTGTDGGSTRAPTRRAQATALQQREPDLHEDVVAALVNLDDGQLEAVERDSISIAQELARQRISEEELATVLDEQLPTELALRSIQDDTAQQVIVPVIEAKMRPTVAVDPDLTAQARQQAAEEVAEVTHVWTVGEAIVREGEVVGPIQYRALEQLGLDGASALRGYGLGVLAMLLVTVVGAVYLWRMHPRTWNAAKQLVLLGVLITTYAAVVVGSSVLVSATSPGWAYVVPAGALGMLAALLVSPGVGVAMMLPAAALALLTFPAAPAVALHAAAAILIAVPLTTQIATRSDLRSSTLRAGLTYPVLAAIVVMLLGPREEVWTALIAAAMNGLVTAVVVQGALPFLETLFRIPTVTALLDLADRNHPLLRELEQKALGTYNHSVMVASLTERACRAVGADPLLGMVAALYHDIGKIRQPHFFIENQHGIANPHDELDPLVSAEIIQRHVPDGVELASQHGLPTEVINCIGSHHGTMVVTFFYEKAVRAAGGDRSAVDELAFRYKGTKPRSKEAAILVLADCSEAVTRAMAMSRGTLPREEIAATVGKLLQERIDDGQFDECDLTFRELRTARDTVVESLVGIYHPRIAYPGKDDGDADPKDARQAEVTADETSEEVDPKRAAVGSGRSAFVGRARDRR